MGRGSVSHTDRERNIPRERRAEGNGCLWGRGCWRLEKQRSLLPWGKLRPRLGMIAQVYMTGWSRANSSPHSHAHTTSSVLSALGLLVLFTQYYPHPKSLAYIGPLAWLGILCQCWTRGGCPQDLLDLTATECQQ